MPRLDFYVNYELQASIKLEDDEVTVGRDPKCTVQIPDAKVSRRHALISVEDDGYAIENFGGNGTRVNGSEITERSSLTPGDAIFISSYILVYQLDDAPVDEMASTVFAG